MKKIILSIGLIFALESKSQNITPAYTPIAIHDFGFDSLTAMDKQIRVMSLSLDALYTRITVYYEVVLISPNGTALQVGTGSYVRDNATALKHFNTLRSSALGVGISQSINLDIDSIKSFSTLQNDLQEK